MINIKLFESKKIRSHRDAEEGKWYFSVVDIIEALTGTERPEKYWNDLKSKLIKEVSELSHIFGQLKMLASDGKKYSTGVADTGQLLRIIHANKSPQLLQ